MKKQVFLILALFQLGVSAGEFSAAIAVRQVTPNPLLPVSGGVGPSHPVSRKAGELTVRALVLANGGERVAIVSADFLGFPGWLCDAVRRSVTGIPATNIIISATHTHSAPDMYGFPDARGVTAMDSNYVRMVCGRMAEAVNEAAGKLQPARVRIATDEARGRIAYNYYAEQLYDPRCSVIQLRNTAGQPIATLVNYAVHPEILGSDADTCSPDLVGPLYDRLAEKGGGVGIFINGAQGGMVTADNRSPAGGESRSWAECERIGVLLADEALRIINDAPDQPDAALACFSRQLTLPVDSPLMRALIQRIPGAPAGQDKVTTLLHLLNVGNAQILTIPGEALPNIGYYLKRKMRGQHNLLFGLTNDAFGYILTKEDFDSFKRYEYVTRTSLGERTWQVYEQEALAMANAFPPQQAK